LKVVRVAVQTSIILDKAVSPIALNPTRSN